MIVYDVAFMYMVSYISTEKIWRTFDLEGYCCFIYLSNRINDSFTEVNIVDVIRFRDT